MTETYSQLVPIVVEQTYLEMKIFYVADSIPENYTILGDIFVGPYDAGQDCGYDSVLNKVAEKTKGYGGNAFKITSLKNPSIDNNCYRVHALALISND